MPNLTTASDVDAFLASADKAAMRTNIGLSTADELSAPVFAADAGASDTYVAALSPAPSAYVTGAHYRFKANTANTGAATINFNALGAITIVKVAGGITTALADNDIRAGQWVDVVYDGTNMQMQSVLGNAASGDMTKAVYDSQNLGKISGANGLDTGGTVGAGGQLSFDGGASGVGGIGGAAGNIFLDGGAGDSFEETPLQGGNAGSITMRGGSAQVGNNGGNAGSINTSGGVAVSGGDIDTTAGGDITSGTGNVNLGNTSGTLQPHALSALGNAAQQAAVSVASAATCDIGAATSDNVLITGATNISGLGTVAAGIRRYCRFAEPLNLIHHATSLILPGDTNILTAADDSMLCLSLGSGNWKVLAYWKQDGTAVVSSGGGLVNLTETLATASPNNTVNAAQLGVTGGTTNVDLALTPKGTGALLAQIPDSTATAGNKRGTYAVDWQIIRGAAADVASGIWSTISGGKYNKASAQYATVVGGYGNIASSENAVAGGWLNTASGASAVALGYQNTASANYATAMGLQNTASGSQSSALGGYANTASGQESVVIGGLTNTASAMHSVVIGGTQGKADRQGMVAHSAGMFAAQGDAQDVSFVLRTKTTTNAAVEMYLQGSSVRLTIPSGKVLHCTVKLVGVKSDGTAVATYLRQVCIKNVAGTTALVGSVITLGTDEAAGTSVSITASDANDALIISPTGITAEVWRWVAVVEGVEVAYGT